MGTLIGVGVGVGTRLHATVPCRSEDRTMLEVVELVKDGVPQQLPADYRTTILNQPIDGRLFDPVSGTMMFGSVMFK